jgi:DNA-binding response OmpR family regulator
MASEPATTILIADPNKDSQDLLVNCLKSRYNVICSGSISETMEMLSHHHPQILLLELNQPDGDGKQLIPQLRAQQDTRSLIIGCVTERESIADKVSGFQAGADDYVVKPINPRTFMWRIVLLIRVHEKRLHS